MTDTVYLSDNHVTIPQENPRAFGQTSDGWVVPDTGVLISDVNPDVSDGPLNGFDYDESATTVHTILIETGEAMISGSPVARDSETVIELAASTNDQIIYIGYEPGTNDTLIVDLDSGFTSSAVRIPAHSFDTDSDSVTNHERLFDYGPVLDIQNTRYEPTSGSGASVYDSDRLGGVLAQDWARTDVSETFNGVVNFANDTDHGGNILQNAERAEISPSGNDVLRMSDGSSGSNTTPHTFVFNDRDLRFFAGDTSTNVISFVDDGGVQIHNNVLNMSNQEIIFFRVDNRTNRPSGTETGRMIYRTDKE